MAGVASEIQSTQIFAMYTRLMPKRAEFDS